MLYIGNFSYSDAFDENDNYCVMPAIVDAPDAETALERFSEMLRRLHEDTFIIDGAKDVFLDSLVEISENPEEALLVQWQKIVMGEDGLYSVLSALPGDDGGAEAYSLGNEDIFDDSEDEDEDGDEDLDASELEDALAEALSTLLSGDLEYLSEDELNGPEEAFISFEE